MNLQALGRDSDYRVGYGEMGHTIDIDRLPEYATVLDVGCRGFAFTKDILAARPMARVVSLDPDPLIEYPKDIDCAYYRVGLTGRPGLARSQSYISTTIASGDGGANFIMPLGASKEKVIRPDCGWEFTDHQVQQVLTMDIQEFMRLASVKYWDAVKLDCEGMEFEILENWPGPIADQISVEFHDFTGPRRHLVDDGYYEKVLWPHLTEWYEVAKHDWVDLNGMPNHFGHWDSLLVRK